MRILCRFFIVCLFMCPLISNGQIQLKQFLDTTHMWIGDQQYLHLQFDQNAVLAETHEPLDSLKWMHILSETKWEKTKLGVFEKNILFTIFDSGYFVIPPLVFVDSSRNIKLMGQSSPIMVNYIPDDKRILLPIKDIEETKAPSRILYFAVIAGLILLLMFYVLWFFYKADSIKHSSYFLDEAIRPWQKALVDLDILNSKKYWEQNQLKLYYTELNFILRKFLWDGLKIPALENPTSEILNNIQSKILPLEHEDQLAESLRLADKVKFANYNAPNFRHEQQREIAREFILANKELSEDILENAKVTWSSLLPSEWLQYFEYPNEIVPNEFIQLGIQDQRTKLVLLRRLIFKSEFMLPESWVKYHQSKVGQLTRWQNNLVNQNQNPVFIALIIFMALPIVAISLPFIFIAAKWKKESIFSRGIFVLGPNNKLHLDRSKL